MSLLAVSHDSVETLGRFAEERGITFSLLSDESSQTIRSLGMLQEDLETAHAAFGRGVHEEQRGASYPGVFVVDSDGIIKEKRIQENYRVRESSAGLVEEALGIAAPEHGSEREVESEAVQVRAFLDSSTYGWYRRLRLTVELEVAPGFHVYGSPSPEGYTSLAVEVSPIPGLLVGEASWPAPHSFQVEGIEDEFWVHDGTVQGTIPLTFTADHGAGEQVVSVTVFYQACSTKSCLLPGKVTMELPVEEEQVREKLSDEVFGKSASGYNL